MITRLILFDIDGTLLMSDGIGREAKRRAMLEYFGEAGDIENHTFGGKTDWRILADLLEPYGKTVDDIGRELPEYEKVMARHMKEISRNHTVEPVPFAMELITTLRDRDDTLVGLVTGNMSKTAPIKLELAGYDPAWFAVGAYGNESPDRNDLPCLAIERAEALTEQSLEGKRVVVIGDTDADIQAARSANATSVAVCTGYVHRDQLISCEPDYLLADLSTFVDLILV